MWKAGWIIRGEWARYLPTYAIMGLERTACWPDYGRDELRARLSRGKLSATQRALLMKLAIHDLGDDDYDWNASFGAGVLEEMGRDAVPALEAALSDPDWQRRQLAACILMQRAPGWTYRWEVGPPEYYDPPDRLFEIAIEALRDDALPYDSRRQKETWISNAFCAVEFLRRYPDRSPRFLAGAIRSIDMQQALLASGVAGFIGAKELAGDAVPVLGEHLADNNIDGDAKFAVAALVGFGDAARPLLEPLLESTDEQQAAAVRVVLHTIAGKRTTPTDRADLKRITEAYADLRGALADGGGLEGLWLR
jgi:hypothetical protein